MVSLPRCLSEALYSLQLRMRYVAFFFIARKAYHVTASATLHSDSCNKAIQIFNRVPSNSHAPCVSRREREPLHAELLNRFERLPRVEAPAVNIVERESSNVHTRGSCFLYGRVAMPLITYQSFRCLPSFRNPV